MRPTHSCPNPSGPARRPKPRSATSKRRRSASQSLSPADAGVGVGEAVLSPAAYSIIADSFPRRRLGLAMGIFGLGSATGAGLAFMIGGAVVALVAQADTMVLPLFGEVRPWQFAFIIAGLPGLLIGCQRGVWS